MKAASIAEICLLDQWTPLDVLEPGDKDPGFSATEIPIRMVDFLPAGPVFFKGAIARSTPSVGHTEFFKVPLSRSSLSLPSPTTVAFGYPYRNDGVGVKCLQGSLKIPDLELLKLPCPEDFSNDVEIGSFGVSLQLGQIALSSR